MTGFSHLDLGASAFFVLGPLVFPVEKDKAAAFFG